MHENVLQNKRDFLDSIIKEKRKKRLYYRNYPLEKLHIHEMNDEELKEFRNEYDKLIDLLFPAQ